MKRILNLILTTCFYSISIYLIFSISNSNFSTQSFFDAVLAPFNGSYWFITAYISLLVASPIYNFFIHRIGQKTHLWICIITFVLFSILPTIFNYLRISTFLTSNFLTSSFLYFTAAYIRLYVKHNEKTKKWLIIFVCILYLLASLLVFYYKDKTIIYESYAVINILISICMFLCFCGTKFKSKIVNTISALTFGIYLIHDNNLTRNWIWGNVAKLQIYNTNFYPLLCLLICCAIFITCAGIEFIRQNIIQKVTNKPIDFLINKLTPVYQSITLIVSSKIQQTILKRKIRSILFKKF